MRILLLLFSFFSLNLRAQEISPKVQRLASRITKNINTDSLKFRAIFEWVTDNISYDTEMLKETDNKIVAEAQEPEKVIKRKKAVCMGYSQLFRDLCMASGITAYYVTGHCKIIDIRTRKLSFAKEGHAWNAIKINNKWYLSDPTWSSGHLNIQTGFFQKQLDEEYYLGNSKSFIKRHLPSDPLWQLSDTPVSAEEFRNDLMPAGQIKLNHLDTLKVFETLTLNQQKLDSGLRSLRFDPTNDEAKSNMGDYYATKAEASALELEDLMKSFINKKTNDSYKKAIEEKDRIYSLLESIEKDYTQSRYYFYQVSPKSPHRSVAIYNMRSAANNLSVNKQHKATLTRYYNALKKMKY